MIESDREAIGLEVEAFASGEYRLARMAEDFAFYTNSPLPRDLVTRAMVGTHAAAARRTPARWAGSGSASSTTGG